MFRWLPGICKACRYRAYKTAERVKRKRARESRSYVQALALRGTKRFFVQRSTFPTSGSVDWGQTWYPDVLGRMGLKKKALQAISSFASAESWKMHKWQKKEM